MVPQGVLVVHKPDRLGLLQAQKQTRRPLPEESFVLVAVFRISSESEPPTASPLVHARLAGLLTFHRTILTPSQF